MEELKNTVKGLPEGEWQDFYTWVLMDERKRRESLPAMEAGKVEALKGLREQGVVESPEPGAPFQEGVTYIEGDEVSIEDLRYKLTSSVVTKDSPSVDTRWTLVTENEDAEVVVNEDDN